MNTMMPNQPVARRIGEISASKFTIMRVINNGAGKCRFECAGPHLNAPAALVAVTGTTVAGYNVDPHTISTTTTLTFDTDKAFTSVAFGGQWAPSGA